MRKTWILGRSGFLALLVGTLVLPYSRAQPPGSFNVHWVKVQNNVQDKGDIWVFDFAFKDPRLITVDIPGRGRKLCWYMWYQIVNNTGQAHTPTLDFELVTLDKPGAYQDEILPKVQEAIQKIEDPTGFLEIKNTVTIRRPLSPSKKDALPHAVSGVAIWDDTTKEQNLRDTTRFSIFVSGLSNGWSVDDNGKVRRKTLQLNFRRLGDRFYQDSREIRYVPPEEWVYRAVSFPMPGGPAAPGMKETELQPPPNITPLVPLRKASLEKSETRN
jgi:hypothetical protein